MLLLLQVLLKWVIAWPFLFGKSLYVNTQSSFTHFLHVFEKRKVLVFYLMIGQSYHWRWFPAQLSPWQQEREVERSAMCGGRRGASMSWSAFFGDSRCLIELRQVGLQCWAPASQEHKWSCVNSLCAGGNQIHHNPHLFPRVVSLLLWKVDSSEAADHVVLNSTLTQNNYYWISFTWHFIVKLPVHFHLFWTL